MKSRRRLGLAAALLCLVGALAAVANGFRLERDSRDRRDTVIAEGVTESARVLGSLRNRQYETRRRRVRSTDPDRVYIVGATPWNWWTAMRSFFVTAAVIAGLVAVGALVCRSQLTRTSSA